MIYKRLTANISAIWHRKCTKHSNAKGSLTLYHLFMGILRRLILKPRTDLFVFIFGGRQFQDDDPKNAKLVFYRSKQIRGKT